MVNDYLVVVSMQIHSTFAAMSTNDVWLERRLSLPFPPFVGLELMDGNWDAVLTSVCWDVKDRTFYAYVEPDKEIYHAELHGQPHRPLEEIVAEWVENGWQVRERKRRNDDGAPLH